MLNKMKKLEFKIPVVHITLILMFMLIVNMIIEQETQVKSEIFGVIYSFSFFLVNDIYAIILGILLIIPFPLLLYSIFKKRKNLIIGFSFSVLISIIFFLIANNL